MSTARQKIEAKRIRWSDEGLCVTDASGRRYDFDKNELEKMLAGQPLSTEDENNIHGLLYKIATVSSIPLLLLTGVAFAPHAAYASDYSETDSDGDGLPDYKEKWFGTDPDNWDTDGDMLRDGMEAMPWNHKHIFGDDSTKWPNPLRMDLNVHLQTSKNTEIPEGTENLLIEMFGEIPVVNPDGSGGISLHIHNSEDKLDIEKMYVGASSMESPDHSKNLYEKHFPDHKRGGFIYGVMAPVIIDKDDGSEREVTGIADLEYTDTAKGGSDSFAISYKEILRYKPNDAYGIPHPEGGKWMARYCAIIAAHEIGHAILGTLDTHNQYPDDIMHGKYLSYLMYGGGVGVHTKLEFHPNVAEELQRDGILAFEKYFNEK